MARSGYIQVLLMYIGLLGCQYYLILEVFRHRNTKQRVTSCSNNSPSCLCTVR